MKGLLMNTPIENRYEFTLFFDVKNGNPNGDPDAGNMPRIDPNTGHGIVSDVCLKRKVRNYVDLVKNQNIDDPDADDGELGYKIYVQEGAVLNQRNEKAYKHFGLEPSSKLPKEKEESVRITKFMCDNFFDVRAFGAVMTTGVNCGQVRGPIQLCFAESVDPVELSEMCITRMAVTNEKDADKERTMGRKQYIPYGLYRVNGFISASLAEQTGFNQEDIDLFFASLMNMFENDHSAARGLMSSRKLFVFKHDSKLGNAPAHQLFDLIKVERLISADETARSFDDYAISIADTPEGVELIEFI